ncbi:hypothetical protein VIGAN_06169500 [Vigna angularis var. angularis]|uniref:Uncharacterized protein n=1 Tax=Vigna angularis var. angularis TaxID=157739 RepID=A0A0S3SC66_PHAAN|nr:hypothetical protein VIGAN_06169500 [Vigna angularis var. angularis]
MGLFANSDPNMFVVPVPVAQVHDWVQQNIVAALEYISEWTSSKKNGSASPSDHDVAMTDASSASVNKASTSTRGSILPSLMCSDLHTPFLILAPLKDAEKRLVKIYENDGADYDYDEDDEMTVSMTFLLRVGRLGGRWKEETREREEKR